MEEQVWALWHGGERIAGLVVTGSEFPWLHGRVEESPGFDAVRELFVADERALEAEDDVAMEAAYQAIRARTAMTYPDGGQVPEYWLHIFGDGTCGWRFADAPFDDAADDGAADNDAANDEAARGGAARGGAARDNEPAAARRS